MYLLMFQLNVHLWTSVTDLASPSLTRTHTAWRVTGVAARGARAVEAAWGALSCDVATSHRNYPLGGMHHTLMTFPR